MAYIKPKNVISPKNKWKLKYVIYDGGSNSYSLAKGIWDNKNATVIRWNGNNENKKGHPISRGYPTWFILPEEIASCFFLEKNILNEKICRWCRENYDEDSRIYKDNKEKHEIEKIYNKKNIEKFLYLIVAGDKKSPLKNFLNLVSKHHKKDKGDIKEVIITDPYILSEFSEEGKSGGFINLIKYLEELGIDKNYNFTFKYLGAPKGQTDEKIRLFENKLKIKFTNIKFNRLNMQFHDRLYIIKDNQAVYRGLFGPSLNGLTAKSIVLMGEIKPDTIKDLKCLRR